LHIRNAIDDLLDRMKERNTLVIKENAEIMIKPNICLVKGYETGATIDPFVVKCLVDWLLKNYKVKNIVIGEADATKLNVDIAFKVLGWTETFDQYSNVRLLNLSKDEMINVNLDGFYFKNLKMPKSYMGADYLISVGKLKTHDYTVISCILKNQFGANPAKYKAKYHKLLDEVICDMNKIRIPDFCLIDGILAMGGNGPIDGEVKPMGLLIAGNDAVATDHACARIMGFNPNRINHIKLASKKGVGSTNYIVLGKTINQVKVEFISRFKKSLRNKLVMKFSPLKKLITIFHWIKEAFKD
jgi:uncharacterized protein (DUF362 family)